MQEHCLGSRQLRRLEQAASTRQVRQRDRSEVQPQGADLRQTQPPLTSGLKRGQQLLLTGRMLWTEARVDPRRNLSHDVPEVARQALRVCLGKLGHENIRAE